MRTAERRGDEMVERPNVILISLLAGSIGFVLLLLAQSYAVVLITTGFFVLTTTFFARLPPIASFQAANFRVTPIV